jgi:hypothetical protein
MAYAIERSWYGDRMGTPHEVGRALFGQDMVQLREWGETVNVWEGLDREGGPLKVVWVNRPTFGLATLYAYEISHAN